MFESHEIKLGSILIKGSVFFKKVLQQRCWEFGIYFSHVELDRVFDGDVNTNTASFKAFSVKWIRGRLSYIVKDQSQKN